MGDSLPRTPLNHRANFDVASCRLILAGEIRNRTNAQKTNKQTNKKGNDIFTPRQSACVKQYYEVQYNTIQYKTCNAPYVTRMLFLGSGMKYWHNDGANEISSPLKHVATPVECDYISEQLRRRLERLAHLLTGRLCQVPTFWWQMILKRGVVRVTWRIFNFAIISPERLKRELPNFVCRWNISNASLGMTCNPLMGVVRVTWPVFLNIAPIISLESVKLGTSNVVCWLMQRY